MMSSVSKIAESSHCSTLVSSVANPSSAEALLRAVYREGIWNAGHYDLFSNPDNIEALLAVAADTKVDCKARICVLECLTHFNSRAHEHGAARVCVRIMQEPGVPDALLNTTRKLFSGWGYDEDLTKRMELIKEVVAALAIVVAPNENIPQSNSSSSTIVVDEYAAAKTLRLLTGWYFNERSLSYEVEGNIFHNLNEEEGVLEAITSAFKQSSNFEIICDLSVVLYHIMSSNNNEGCSILLNLDIADITLYQLLNCQDKLKCVELLYLLYIIVQTQTGQDKVLATAVDLNALFSNIAESFEKNQEIIRLQPSLTPLAAYFSLVVSKLSFNNRIHPFIDEMISKIENSDMVMLIIGGFVGDCVCSFVYAHNKISEVIFTKILVRSNKVLTGGELRLLKGFLDRCLGHETDEILGKGIIGFLVASIQVPETSRRAWHCVLSLVKSSQKAFKLVCASEIVSFLPQVLESADNKTYFATCCSLINEILKFEEGAAILPTTQLINALAAQHLDISDDFISTRNGSAVPEALKAAELLKSIIEKQPPATMNSVLNTTFDACSSKLFKLLLKYRCITDNSSTKFIELGSALKNCDAFVALKATWLKSVLAGIADNNINWEEFCLICKFLPARGENSYTEKQITDSFDIINKAGTSKMVTEDSRICFYLLLIKMLGCFNSTTKKRILDTGTDMMIATSSKLSLTEMSIILDLISNLIDGSVDELLDLVVQKQLFISKLLTLFKENFNSRHRIVYLILPFIKKLIEKYVVKGKEKMKVLSEILFSSNILDVMSGVAAKEIYRKHSDWYRILGRLSAIESSKASILDIVAKLPFYHIEMFMSSNEGFLSGTSDARLFQLVCDSFTTTSIFDALTKQEKCSLLEVITKFADSKSPQASTTLAVLAPRAVDIMHKYSSNFSLTCQGVVGQCIQCFVNWYSINELTLATAEMKDLFLKLLLTSFEIGRMSRFDSLINILKSCVKHSDTRFEEFVKEVLSTLVDYVSGKISMGKSSLYSRMALEFLKKIFPHADYSPAVMKFVIICNEAGLIGKLIEIIKASNGCWDRFRLLNHADLIGLLLCTKHEAALQSFNKCGGFNLILQTLKKDPYNMRGKCLYSLQNYTSASKLSDRESLLDNGLLEIAETIVREGPMAQGYNMILAVLQLLCLRGSDRLRDLVTRSKACQMMVESLIDGSCLESNLTRTHYLVAFSAHLNTKANAYIVALIDSLDPSDIKKSIKVMGKLKHMCSSCCQFLFELYESKGIAAKLLSLYNAATAIEDKNSILDFAIQLASLVPSTFVIFDKVCAQKLHSKLFDNESASKEADLLSKVSQYSSRARSTIASLPYRIHEEADTGSEFFANSVFDVLIKICDSDHGITTLADSGGIEIITQSLVRVKSTDSKCKVMQLLAKMCEFESNRSRLRSLIEPIFSILKTHFHMIIAPPVSDSSINSSIVSNSGAAATFSSAMNASKDNKKLYDFDVFLSHNWGPDELNRDNHARVSKINSELQSRGLVTWFDGDQMRGSINSKMMDGITKSAVVIVFVTNSFIKKASGFGDKGEDDSCFFEFDCAIQERGRGNIISVVMEPSCRDTGTWLVGVVKGKLGSKLYIDLSDDESSSNYIDGFNNILKEITIISGKTFGGISATSNPSNPNPNPSNNALNINNNNTSNNSAAVTPSSPKSPTSPTSPSSKKSSKFVDTSTSSDDLKIGSNALHLLLKLSYSDANRSSFESIDSLIPYIEFICERHKNNRDSAICLLVNVFAPIMHLKGKNDLIDKHYNTIKESLVTLSVFNDLRSLLRKAWYDCSVDKSKLCHIGLFLQLIFNFSSCNEFCEKLMSTGIISEVMQMMFDGLVTIVRLKTSHKITASDILMRCAQNPDYRSALREYGADKLLRLYNGSVKPDDDDEENARLWFSSKQAMESLSGRNDVNGIYSHSFKTSELLKKPRLDESDISDLPTFQTFISHKRSSAQDFARLLHSLIIGGGLTCFLDVENLDRLDMLTLLVAGCDVFVCVLSDDVFQSPFWKKELACAVSLSIPVILVVKEGSRWPDRFGQLTDSFPSYELIDKEFQGDYACCRDVFKSKAVQHSNEYFRSFSFNIIHKIESQLKELEKNRDRTISKKELLQRRRRNIFASGKFDMSTGGIVPSTLASHISSSISSSSSSSGSSTAAFIGNSHSLSSNFNEHAHHAFDFNKSIIDGRGEIHGDFGYSSGNNVVVAAGGSNIRSLDSSAPVDKSSSGLAYDGSPIRSSSSPDRPLQYYPSGPKANAVISSSSSSSSSSAYQPKPPIFSIQNPSLDPNVGSLYHQHHQQQYQQQHLSQKNHPSIHANALVSSNTAAIFGHGSPLSPLSPHSPHSPHNYPSNHSLSHYYPQVASTVSTSPYSSNAHNHHNNTYPPPINPYSSNPSLMQQHYPPLQQHQQQQSHFNYHDLYQHHLQQQPPPHNLHNFGQLNQLNHHQIQHQVTHTAGGYDSYDGISSPVRHNLIGTAFPPPPPASPPTSATTTATNPTFGGGGVNLLQSVGSIKQVLGIDPLTPMVDALSIAFQYIGEAPQGSVIDQVRRLQAILGIL